MVLTDHFWMDSSRRGYHLALSVEENSQINVVIPSLFVDRVQTRKGTQ
jgi:hypothetical protein